MGFEDSGFEMVELPDDKATCEIREEYNLASMWARYDI